MIGDAFEVILPNYVKNVVVFEDYVFALLDDLIGNIFLFKRQAKSWTFVAVLESFPHQSLINRRLRHIFLDENDITFVYNNRVRKYDLKTGKMIANQQVRDARSKEYSGNNIISKFVKKRTYY